MSTKGSRTLTAYSSRMFQYNVLKFIDAGPQNIISMIKFERQTSNSNATNNKQQQNAQNVVQFLIPHE
jgi:hypothetical protein